jgi:hypothetical protein
MSTIPKDIPYDIWRVASAVHENAKQPGPAVNSFTIDERTLAVEVSLLLMAERAAAEQRGAERERDRCRGVANERAAQAYAALQLPSSDEARQERTTFMVEALLIEQRITDGHQPKETINIQGLHDRSAAIRGRKA